MRRSSKYLYIQICIITTLVLGLIGLTVYVSKEIYDSIQVDNNTYVLESIADEYIPVVEEVDNEIIKPFDTSDLKIIINYYKLDDTEENQQRSIINYENNYMPSTGILYGKDSEFEVLSIYDGEVIDIQDDETLGKVISIKHSNNLIAKYSSLSKTDLNIGDKIIKGEVIGTSGINKISAECQNMLYLEIIKNGEYVSPDTIYNLTIDETN